MMQEITETLHEYLEAKRHIWNAYFRSKVLTLRECSPLDQYEEIDMLLFYALVVQQSPFANRVIASNVTHEPWKYIRVKAREGLSILSLRISDPIINNNRVWNDPRLVEVTGEASFGFIKFFDWVPYGFATYPYIRVRIDEQSGLPALTGNEALIEVMNGTFWACESL